MKDPILVVITAEGCPACSLFLSQIWPDLRTRINSLNVQTLSIDSSQLYQFRKDLQNFIGWYPTLLMFPQSSWKDTSQDLSGSVYGGYYDPIEKQPKLGNFSLSADEMYEWIQDNIDTAPVQRPKPRSKRQLKYSFVEI